MSPLKSTDERSIQIIASNHARGYRSLVAANSATDLGRSSKPRRTSAQITIAGAFFVPAIPCNGGCARDTFGCAGSLGSRSANLRTVTSIPRLAASGGDSSNQGVTPMIPTCNPSALLARAAAHRAMAMSALSANSSVASRLKRYNAHMSIARSLQALEAATLRGGAV